MNVSVASLEGGSLSAFDSRAMPKASDLSSSRQQQLRRDCLRTRAVSIYLADHRECLTKALPRKFLRDKNQKRRELERLAREAFKKLTKTEQETYVSRAETASGGAGKRCGDQSGDACRSSGDEAVGAYSSEGRGAGAKPPTPRTPAASAALRTTPPAQDGTPLKRQRPASLAQQEGSTLSGLDQHWGAGSSTLHGALLRQGHAVRQVCGSEAGALETLASGIRILDAIDLGRWSNRVAVKVAVVAGMAAKLSQPLPSDELRKLWAKIAGKASEVEIRQLEREVLAIWARKGLSG